MSYTHLSAKGCSHNPIVGILLCRLQSLLSVIANNRLLYQPQLKQRKSTVKSLCHSQILLITVQGLTNPLNPLYRCCVTQIPIEEMSLPVGSSMQFSLCHYVRARSETSKP